MRGWWMMASLCMTSLALALPVQAARSVVASGPIQLRLELHQLTVVRLPEPISSATSPLDEKVMQVGEDGVYLTLIPLFPEIPPGRIAVVGMSGTLYLLRYQLVPTQGDDVVTLTQTKATKTQSLTVHTLLRLMRTGKVPPGAQEQPPLVPTPSDARVLLGDATMMQVDGKQALTLQVENTQDVPVTLDIRVGRRPETPVEETTLLLDQWAWPPGRSLRALAVEQDVLPPHARTTLYVIYEER